MSQDLSEQESLRIAKLEELQKLGINPFPSEEYKTSHNSAEILKKFSQDPESEELKNISIAGRLMSIRVMGKLLFAFYKISTAKFNCTFNVIASVLMKMILLCTTSFSKN